MCKSCDFNSCCYANAIFQENQEELKNRNFPGKPGRVRKSYLQKQSLDTILTLIQVYSVITLLLALSQGVYICVRPVILTATVTQTQFSRKTRKS